MSLKFTVAWSLRISACLAVSFGLFGTGSALAQQASATTKKSGWRHLKPSWHFEPHSYYDPLSAEPRAAETKVLFPARSSSVPYAVNPGQSLVWDISVGTEIPIVGWTNTTDTQTRNSPVGAKKFGIGLWFPLSFHMVEDMHKDPSAPILDTDYRFGGMIKAQWGLPETWHGIHDGHLGLRYVPIAHESTHLGDEFTLGATKKYGNRFERVNVSYQYWELGGSFEPNVLHDGRLQLKLRGGVIHEAFHHGIGWYDTDLLQPIGGSVTPSRRNIEPYAGIEAFLAPADTTKSHFGPFLSLDYRDRTVYGYHRASASVPEDTQGSVNVMIGARELVATRRFTPSYYVRYYHGVNPAGQFRSQKNYQLYGIGFLVHF